MISNFFFTPFLILCSFPEDFGAGRERCCHSLLFYLCHGPSGTSQWRANGSRSPARLRKWWIQRSRRHLVSTNCSIYFSQIFSRGTYELNVNIIAEISSYCNRHFKNLIPYMQCLVEKLQHQIVDLTVACQKEID